MEVQNTRSKTLCKHILCKKLAKNRVQKKREHTKESIQKERKRKKRKEKRGKRERKRRERVREREKEPLTALKRSRKNSSHADLAKKDHFPFHQCKNTALT